MKQVDITDESELEEYSVEIDILSQCRHKNIVGIYEAYYFNSKLCVSILCTHIQPRYHCHNESTVCICVTMKCRCTAKARGYLAYTNVFCFNVHNEE